MRVFRETTDWSKGGYEWIRLPNHVYLVESNFMYGYQQYGRGPAIYFKNRMQLDKKYRKFEEIPKNSPNNPFHKELFL